MAKNRTREDYVVFPVSLLALWWDEQCFDFRNVLYGIVKHAKSTDQINPNHKEAWAYLSRAAKEWHRSNNNHKQREQSISNAPLTSIAIETLSNYVSGIDCNGVNLKDDLGLLAYLAIKSKIGRQLYDHFSWDAIVARMLGRSGGKYSELPKPIQDEAVWAAYCLGKRGRENLIEKLKSWRVAYVPNGKGFKAPVFSYKLSQMDLEKTLEATGKTPISMKVVKHKKDIPF